MPKVREHKLLWARVNRVIDGDTVAVECGPLGWHVRFADCNTPERGKPGYAEAKAFTAERILNKVVGLEHRTQQWDMHGRMLAAIWYGKDLDTSLSEALLAGGYADADPTLLPAPMALAPMPS
jgi:micrococcal nuclease